MHRKKRFSGKVFATYVAISFLFVCLFIVILYFGFEEKINKFANMINTIAIKKSDEQRDISFDSIEKRLTSYPAYGSKYANIVIPAIELTMPLYYGDNLDILSHGIGQYAGSYFPGEGGTIILAGHNNKGYFDRILDLKKGDKVTIEADYGTFEYIVDSNKIINENDVSAFPIQTEREMLIMYTCYPLGIGHKTERYLVFAYKAGDNSE